VPAADDDEHAHVDGLDRRERMNAPVPRELDAELEDGDGNEVA